MESKNCNASNMQRIYPPVTAFLLSPNTLMNTYFLDISNRTKFNHVSNEFTASIFMAENTIISYLRFGDAPV
jgi:hypothetical protein